MTPPALRVAAAALALAAPLALGGCGGGEEERTRGGEGGEEGGEGGEGGEEDGGIGY